MIAYLLCAGFGTRMRPLTADTPKSLLPVAGRPILDYLLDNLRRWNALDAIHVAVNHRDADAFRTWAADRRDTLADDGVALTIHDDGVSSPDEQLGAVGDLRFLLEHAGPPPDGALVSGGDSLYRFPLSPILNAFDGGTSRVLALHEPDPQRRRKSSVLTLDGDRVTGLTEDPSDGEHICPSWHLLTPSALAAVDPYLRTGRDPDTLGTFLHVVAQRERVEAVRLPEREGLRLHCNTPEDLERARTLLETDPRHLLDAEAVRQFLPQREP
ncbi:MAG: NTP transferase domain-containing protein [Salinibacter sp.]